MKNLKYHSEIVFGSQYQVGINKYEASDESELTYYCVYVNFDGDEIYYGVFNELDSAQAKYDQIKYGPFIGSKRS